MITEFVVLGNHTFSNVEEEKFKDLMNMSFPKRKCLTRKTLMGRISTISQELKKSLKNNWCLLILNMFVPLLTVGLSTKSKILFMRLNIIYYLFILSKYFN